MSIIGQDPQELSRIQAIHERIARARELEARYAQDTSTQGQIAYRRAQDLLVSLERRRNFEQASLVNQQTLNKELATFSKSYAKLSSTVKAQLQTQSSVNTQTSIYKSLGEEIAKSKAREANLTGEALEHEQERGALMTEVNSSLLSQAKATAKAIDDAKGLTEFDKMRRELKETMLHLSDQERQKLEDAINQTEELYKKEQRILELKSQQDSLINQMPDGIQKSIGFAKGLGNAIKAGMGPLFLIGAVLALAISSFAELDESAKEFRETTGLTNSQMEGIRSQANEIAGEFGNLGIKSKNVFDTVAALKSEFGDVAEFSKETTAALTVLNANFGVSATNAAKVQSQFESIGGLSSETAANVGMQVAKMANLAGVAPAKIFEDIAENAEATSTFFKGDLNALTKNAIQARRMGTSLKEQVALAEKLLDFESGIEEELVAATFVGGQFNLGRARALAMEGKLAEANEETLKQIQRSGDFRKQDYFTQQQLAKAAGMSVEEINKQLNAQEKLSSLSAEQRKAAEDAISKGLDITNINADQLAQETDKFAKQQEQQAQLDKLNNAFMGMAATIGSVLIPVIDAISIALYPVQMAVELIQFVFGGIGEKISAMVGPLNMVGKIIKGLAGVAIIFAAYKAYASFATVPVVGAIKGAIAAAAIVASGFSLLSKIGDLNSPADGKTRVSTKEGGLFELSPNDDLVAAPGAAAALAGASGGGTTTLTDGKSGGGANLAALSAPLNAMINEIKALRADMASGKIAVYMDTAKVTSNISKNVDQGTRNSYNLGSA
jgi:transcriptional regulator with XRE-family HTH domain